MNVCAEWGKVISILLLCYTITTYCAGYPSLDQHTSPYCIWYITRHDNYAGRAYVTQPTPYESRQFGDTSKLTCDAIPNNITIRKKDDWQVIEFARKNNQPQGFFLVRYIGSLGRKQTLYLINDSGGGSGQFSSLVIIRKDHSGIHYQCKIDAGDRMSGGFSHVELVPGGLLIQRYASDNPAVTETPTLNEYLIALDDTKNETTCTQIKAGVSNNKE